MPSRAAFCDEPVVGAPTGHRQPGTDPRRQSPEQRLGRQPSHAMPTILDGDDGAELESRGRLPERIAQPVDDVIDARITEPKNDDARVRFDAQADEFAEIEVECEEDSMFRGGFREHVRIWEALHPLLAQVVHVVAGVAEPGDDAWAHAHVSEKSHRAP